MVFPYGAAQCGLTSSLICYGRFTKKGAETRVSGAVQKKARTRGSCGSGLRGGAAWHTCRVPKPTCKGLKSNPLTDWTSALTLMIIYRTNKHIRTVEQIIQLAVQLNHMVYHPRRPHFWRNLGSGLPKPLSSHMVSFLQNPPETEWDHLAKNKKPDFWMCSCPTHPHQLYL